MSKGQIEMPFLKSIFAPESNTDHDLDDICNREKFTKFFDICEKIFGGTHIKQIDVQYFFGLLSIKSDCVGGY